MSGEVIELTGARKAAVLLMSLDVESAREVMTLMSKEEIRLLSEEMTKLGKIDNDVAEDIVEEVWEEVYAGDDIIGNISSTERFLIDVLGEEEVKPILNKIKGPKGNTIWEKLENVEEEKLFLYIKDESAQTIALLLSRLSSNIVAKIIPRFDDDIATDILLRLTKLSNISDEVFDVLEHNLESEFLQCLDTVESNVSDKIVCDIFNNFNKTNEARFMTLITKKDKQLAQIIRDNMFVFDDLKKIGDDGMKTIVSVIDKNLLPRALKGAEQELQDKFLNNMSERAAKIIKEDMMALGPIKMSEVDESQNGILVSVKELLDNGSVNLDSENSEDLVE